MSMNLCCKQMELWQTPTHITYMCLFTHDGQQDDWRNVKFRYIQWVKSNLNGVWTNEELHKACIKQVNDHIADINSYDTLDFYMT